jgi:hypothetical protein
MSIENTTQTVERLLRWEEAAGAAYERASRSASAETDAVKLYELREDHRYAELALRNLLLRLHATGELRGEMPLRVAAEAAEEIAIFFGRTATLASLEQAEKVLERRIDSAVRSRELYPEAMDLLSGELLPRCRARIHELGHGLTA